MDRPGHQDTEFFWGDEVECTPAHGEPTLFVVAVPDFTRIAPDIQLATGHVDVDDNPISNGIDRAAVICLPLDMPDTGICGGSRKTAVGNQGNFFSPG